MKRREFIKNSLLSTGAVALTNCKGSVTTDPTEEVAFSGTVAIIGAGVAGLYAGYLLEQKNVKYVIFEASDVIGGRIRPLKGFADFDVEIGADKIFGKKSVWYDWVKEANPTFLDNTKISDYYQIGTQIKTDAQWQTDAEFVTAQNMVTQAQNYVGATDVTVQRFR